MHDRMQVLTNQLFGSVPQKLSCGGIDEGDRILQVYANNALPSRIKNELVALAQFLKAVIRQHARDRRSNLAGYHGDTLNLSG